MKYVEKEPFFFGKGSILTLAEDDGTKIPLFVDQHGNERWVDYGLLEKIPEELQNESFETIKFYLAL